MSNKLTIKKALKIWEQEEKKLQDKNTFHPNPDLIKRFANGEEIQDKERWIKHIANCITCLNKWIDEMKPKYYADQYTDVVLAKVAAEENNFQDLTKIYSQSGKYLITFRNSLEEADTCMITLNILDNIEKLEGMKVVVRDKNNRKLLVGKISQGEVSNWINDLNNIDMSFLSIIPGE